MKIQEITATLMNNMDYVSLAIVASIVLVFIIAIAMNMSVGSRYKKMLKELDEVNNDGMEIYKNPLLNKIVSSFKTTYEKTQDVVNTQAIIESKLYGFNKDLLGKEKFLGNATTIMITLGLVGTLYSIIVLTTNLTELFKGIEFADITSLQSLIGNVATIISFLAVAFLTTFVAILASFLYTVLTSMSNIGLIRGSLLSKLENYLDNELGATLSSKKIDNTRSVSSESGIDPNSNVLYMLGNTSTSMLEATAKLESTLAKLNKNLAGIAQEEKIEEKFKSVETNKSLKDSKSFLERKKLEKQNRDKEDLKAKSIEKELEIKEEQDRQLTKANDIINEIFDVDVTEKTDNKSFADNTITSESLSSTKIVDETINGSFNTEAPKVETLNQAEELSKVDGFMKNVAPVEMPEVKTNSDSAVTENKEEKEIVMILPPVDNENK